MLPTQSLTTSAEAFDELRSVLHAQWSLREKYERLNALLRRLCTERTAGSGRQYSGLFSQLFAVCREAQIDHHVADRFRRNARLVLLRQEQPTDAGLRDDAARLAQFVARLFGEAVPQDLPLIVEDDEAPSGHTDFQLRRRAVVERVGENGFFCQTDDDLHLFVPAEGHERTFRLLREGDAVNLLEGAVDDDGTTCCPRFIVLDPDCLMDVSALCSMMRPYGSSPLNGLVDRLSDNFPSSATLLGDAANAFMDALVNTQLPLDDAQAMERLYADTVRTHFLDKVLEYSTLTEPLTRDYFDRMHQAFANILQTVREVFPQPGVGLQREDLLLEPSFICESLGLRGRLDVMTMDHRAVLELKSGRADDFRRQTPQPSLPHALQMMLYKEMLHYIFSLRRDDIRSYLFYSRYPSFFDQRSSQAAIHEALSLRNEVVALEARMREEGVEGVVDAIQPAAINLAGLTNRLWTDFTLPKIEAIRVPLKECDLLTKKYFTTFLTFVEREKYATRTMGLRPDSNRGLASAWMLDAETKVASGDMIVDLRLVEATGTDGIEHLRFALPQRDDGAVPNFSVGEMVQLYERNSDHDCVATRQLTRCYISHVSDASLQLRLLYRQRNVSLFPTSSLYAIEHDGTDSLYRQQERGLMQLVQCSQRRRSLLLGTRPPERSASGGRLMGTYDEQTSRIVSDALSAHDFYLLVGPPGTGKTSVALKSISQEFLLRRSASGTDEGLLLMAYTNRAVDEICSVLERLQVDYLRIGTDHCCAPQFLPRLVRQALAPCRNRTEVLSRLKRTPVVVGTVATMANNTALFRLRQYTAIIDEASQVLEPQLLSLLCADGPKDLKDAAGQPSCGIVRFIMIGDHKQLPAVVQLQPEHTAVTDPDLLAIGLTDLRNSLFERLHRLQTLRSAADVAHTVGLLARQGRMHVDIASFVNRTFYDGLLRPVPLPHQEEQLHAAPADADEYERFVCSTRMGFVDVRPPQPLANVKANALEAEEVARLVTAICAAAERDGRPFSADLDVAVIVPFRNQIGVVREALRRHGVERADEMTIDTVECLQGSQRDYILFSTTISRPYQLNLLSTPAVVEGREVDRKLNVAVTRARRQFFLVGNGPLLRRSTIYAQLIDACLALR